jgi:hypothetical protein
MHTEFSTLNYEQYFFCNPTRWRRQKTRINQPASPHEAAKQAWLNSLITYVKNLRSHLEESPQNLGMKQKNPKHSTPKAATIFRTL